MLAALGGLALLAAHPPLGWWWTTFLAPALLLAAIEADAAAADEARGGPRAFRLGLVFGLVAFGPMLSWLVLPAGYLGWGLLVGVQAGWMGLVGLLVSRAIGRWWLAPATAIAWTGVDAWRAIIPMNGFEWGAIAYAHVDGSWLAPLARLTGGRGITLLVVLISALAFEAVRRTVSAVAASERGALEGALRPVRGTVAALVGAVLVSVLATVGPPPEEGSIDVLTVQGNDHRHWEQPDPDLRDSSDVRASPQAITTAMRDLTLDAVADDPEPDLVVWPESSIDRGLYGQRGQDLVPLVEEAAAAVGHLLAGANLDGPDPESQFYNTAILLEGGLPHEQAYVKRRLVPFGEYVPFRRYLDWFPPLEQIPRDGQPGPAGQTLRVGDARIGVIICFETLFTNVTRANLLGTDDPANLLIAITNNASFGDSAQPAQHLAQTRLRALETGRWAVHGALSGASAFVDPDGGSHQVTDLFTLTTIRDRLPLVEEPTVYLRTGDVVGIATRVLVVLGLLGLLVDAWRRRGERAAG